MEVDFILSCLFMLCLSTCVGLRQLPLDCLGCVCTSHNGAKLSLKDIFNTPLSKSCNKLTYQFPSCLSKNSSNLVCITNDYKQDCLGSGTVLIQTEVANNTNDPIQRALDDNNEKCPIIISCSPITQLDDHNMVFYVSHCGELKGFISSVANMNTPPTAALSTLSVPPPPFVSTSQTIPTAPSPFATTSNVTTSSSPNGTKPPTHPHSDDSEKLLYIVIPTAAPVAFILSFITVFCLLHQCHQRNKKKLYIKLTSTIYSEDNSSSDDSDE